MSPIGFKLLLKQIQTDEEDNSKSIREYINIKHFIPSQSTLKNIILIRFEVEGALSKASSNADHENFKSPSGFSTESKGISKMHKQVFIQSGIIFIILYLMKKINLAQVSRPSPTTEVFQDGGSAKRFRPTGSRNKDCQLSQGV